MPRVFTCLFLLCYTGSGLQAQQSPEQALGSFTVAEGLKLELFASEPMFVNPTCMDIDERGRVWVCESVNYRTRLFKKPLNRPEGDRIVILHDTDGDGKADKATTFYQAPDFLAPLGIAVAKDPTGPGYKVYVCHSPHIYVFEDKDGDGKADGPPKILLTGFNGIDHDHGVHGIHFGPDGMLYFSVGDQGVKNLKDKNGKVWTTNQTDCKAGTIWRCKTDGSGLELLAHNFRNQYEPAVNSFGTMFVSDNDDDGHQQTRICHVMYGGDYGYWPRNRGDHHWHEDQPGVVHKVLRTGFGSPTGMCWYEGKLLQSVFSSQLSVVRNASPLSPPGRGAGGEVASSRGEAQRDSAPDALQRTGSKKPLTPNPSPREGEGNSPYEGFLLHTDAGPREVRLFGVRPKGAGYELDKVNLVTSKDNWFRPSDVCVALDGSVFIADWYDPGVGGHGMGDMKRGRIYRLSPAGTKGYSPSAPKQFDLKDAGSHLPLARLLVSPNLSARQLGFHLLQTLTPVQHHMETMLQSTGLEHQHEVPGALARFEYLRLTLDDTFNEALLRSTNPQSAALGVRLGFQMLQQIHQKVRVSDADEKLVRQLLEVKHIAATREALVLSRALPTDLAGELFWPLAKRFDGQDRTYLSALNIAVGTDPKRREAILADFEKHFPEWNDKTAWLVWELRPARVIAKLGPKLAQEPMSPLQTELALGALAATTGTDGGESLLKLLQDTKVQRQVRAAAMKTLMQHLNGKWSSLKSSFLVRKAIEAQMTDGELLPTVVDLVALCERKDFQGFLERLAYNSDGLSDTVRYSAIAGLGKLKTKESVGVLVKLLTRPETPAVRKEIMTALGKMNYSEAIKPLQEYLLDNKAAIEDRRLALEALASSRMGATWLLETESRKELPEVMRVETARLLRSSPYQDLRNKALIAFPISKKMDLTRLPSPALLASKTGNAEHGKELVLTNKDLGCIKCHGFQGLGGQIGPDLSMIGIKGSKENLFESILTPDKAIADQYIQQVIETKNGVVMTGLVVEENNEYLVLRDANGKDSRLNLREIESRNKSAKSIMPDNLASFLTEEELIDVVAYLTTLKSPALTIDRWQVAGPFPNDAKDNALERNDGPEKGYSSTARYDSSFGKVQWKSVAVNSSSYLDLAALHGVDSPMSASYVYAEIEVTKEGWGEIKLGTDDGVNVVFNEKLVYKHRRHEAATPGRDSIAVEFQKGKNTLMLKVSNGDNPHGVYCTVLTPGSEPAKLVTAK